MDLSIIIPAWNEANKIADDIRDISQFANNYDTPLELIIVDDGSKDNTSQIAKDTSVTNMLTKRVINYKPHRGKGYAVRKGIGESIGRMVIFIDSGQNVPLAFINSGIELIEKENCDIAIGSRYLPSSIIKKKLIWYRLFISRLFRLVVRRYLKLPPYISDTQCGFKIFRGEIARSLFGLNKSDGFTFDLEIILRAMEKKYKICEFPIEWTCDRDSRLSLIQSFFSIYSELRDLKKHFL